MRKHRILNVATAVVLTATAVGVSGDSDATGESTAETMSASAVRVLHTGGKIIFVRNNGIDTNAELYTMRADGTRVRRVTHLPVQPYNPEWSPNGRQVTFTAFIIDKGDYVYKVNADGTGFRRLAKDAGGASWSPNGKRVIFGRNGQIWTMLADGTRERRITRDRANLYSPAWSPDGSRIAYERCGDRGIACEIYVMNSNGTRVRRLTNNDAYDGGPVWSPNGKWIAFTRKALAGVHARSDYEIYAMRPNGTGTVNLTNNGLNDALPTWSPNGFKIAFNSWVPGRDTEIYTINANGTARTRLTDTAAEEYHPDWAPSHG